MVFTYHWKNKEANFGPPVAEQVSGGTHITFEVILMKDGKYVGLRRPEGIPGHEAPAGAAKAPKGLLYFCHNLIRYGETVDQCVARIVKEQAGVAVKSAKVRDIWSSVQEKDGQWAFMPYVVAELGELPVPGTYGNEVTEVVTFDASSVPSDFGWWSKQELQEFINEQ